jgi:hypothetical protein
VCLISYGIWNADVPFGDEAGYVSDSYNLHSSGQFTINLYKLSYVAIFKYLTDDPLNAHYLCRFLTSLVSVVLMYFFLKSFKFINNEFALILSCVFWAIARLNIPESQFGNINLFTLNLVFPAVILLMRKFSVERALFLVVSLLWAAQIRTEYYAALAVILCWFGYMFYKRGDGDSPGFRPGLRLIAMVLLLILSITTISVNRTQAPNFDKYLLLGLSQCYTSLYSKLHPEEKMSTMVEYSDLVNKVFNHPTGFIDAAMKNPKEVLKYLILNGGINSVILIPGLLRHRAIPGTEKYGKKGEMLQISVILIILFSATVTAVLKAKTSISAVARSCISNVGAGNLAVLLALCSASLVSIFLLIPDPRYWISFIPLLFLWIAWCLNFIFGQIRSRPVNIAIFAILTVLMSMPMFLGGDTNCKVILKMRQAADKSVTSPTVAGLYPGAIAFFAFKDKCQVVCVGDLKIADFDSRKYDFVVADKYLRDSIYWRDNGSFMDDFEAKPEEHGYSLLCRTGDKYEIAVYKSIYDRKAKEVK